jgi:ferredoxin-NADP reductase
MDDVTTPAARTAGPPTPDARIPVRVAAVDELADGVRALRLEPADAAGPPLPAWAPGAHVDLILPNGIARPYSLCGDPRDAAAWEVAVLREPDSRGGSAYVHDRLAVGDVLAVRTPQNTFPLVPAAEYALIAGGIGITPLLPMIDELERRGARWRLLYGGRRRASMAFVDRLAAFGDRVTVAPEDTRGLLDVDGWLDAGADAAAVYCCGPEPLLDAVDRACAVRPAHDLHVERFRATAAALAGDDAPFVVVAAESGVTVTVAEGQSVVEALEAEGVFIPTSCGEGTCETCLCHVVEGEPDHRDSVLTDDQRARGDFLPCCSRSRSPVIVLDV